MIIDKFSYLHLMNKFEIIPLIRLKNDNDCLASVFKLKLLALVVPQMVMNTYSPVVVKK